MKSFGAKKLATSAWSMLAASGVLIVAGCSKKEAAATPPPPAEAPAVAADSAPPPADGTVRGVSMSEVQGAIDRKEYDAAVAGLVQGKFRAMTAAEKREYDRQFNEANQKLLEAASRDPRAAAAYQDMGRAMLGR